MHSIRGFKQVFSQSKYGILVAAARLVKNGWLYIVLLNGSANVAS